LSSPDDARRRGRRQFLLVASLFVVPLMTAVVLYHSLDWRPVVNARGTLIDPPLTLDTAGLTLADGERTPDDALRGRWSVVRPVAGPCGERERALLEELARVRLALDKDASRVQRVLVHDGACRASDFESGVTDLKVYSTAATGNGWLARFPPAVDGAQGIYIVDPHGNLMMSYPAAGSARGLLSDLERLLRLSSIG
jgi:cytochrome oxidase Cu insertion factor (SCO1/SenC/PrrC family)